MKKFGIFISLICVLCAFFSCSITYNKLADTTYAIELDSVDSDTNDVITGGIKWEFSSEKYPYVGETGYVLTISEYGEFSDEILAAMLEAGIDVSAFESTSATGCWRLVSASKLYVSVPGAGQTKQTYDIEIDDDAGTLTLSNDTSGEVIMYKK